MKKELMDVSMETRERYGNTEAYREHEQKTKNYTKEKQEEANDGLMAIFAEFAACKLSGASAESAEAQALVQHAVSSLRRFGKSIHCCFASSVYSS